MIWSIAKVLLSLFLLAFVGLNVFMQFKPIKAFWLFLKDLRHFDFHRFRGYGFWLYCGLGGSGKTLSMVEYMIRMKRRYPKIKIYTNFNFKLADGKIESWQDILNLENYDLKEISKAEYDEMSDYNRLERSGKYYEKVHNGIIFGFDEIHLTFASQNWEDCPDNMLDYISQQRKLRKQIVASSQVFTRVDKKLREQTNFVIECSSLFMGRWIFNKFFHTTDYLANDEKGDAGARRRKRARRRNFVAYDAIRETYDTYQVMKEVSVGKNKTEVLISKLLAGRTVN